jgi:hypothetical protein
MPTSSAHPDRAFPGPGALGAVLGEMVAWIAIVVGVASGWEGLTGVGAVGIFLFPLIGGLLGRLLRVPPLPRSRSKLWWAAESLLLLWTAGMVGLALVLFATVPEEGTDLRAVTGVVLLIVGAPGGLFALLALRLPFVTGVVLVVGGVPLLSVVGPAIAGPMISGVLFILHSANATLADSQASSAPHAASDSRVAATREPRGGAST